VAKGFPLVTGVPVQTVTLADPAFPRRLRDAHGLCGLPGSLDVRGSMAVADRDPAVAIVGARAALARDLDVAEALAARVAARGGVIISGGAIGVDTAAHRGALGADGATVVVLGTGIDVVYPWRNRALYDQVARTGAVVSRFPRDLAPRRGAFISRNAIIAALADVIVVIGAGETSGAMHTVEAARRLGRPIAAVPGAIGCERLIADGAAIIEGPADLDRCLAGDPRRPAPVAVLDPGSDAHRVLVVLSDRVPRDLDDVVYRTGMPLRDAQRVLADLEIRGLALLAPGQAYLRSPLAVTA
jgi:DNA processing protein